LVRRLWRRYDLAVTTQAATGYLLPPSRRAPAGWADTHVGDRSGWETSTRTTFPVAAEPDRHRVTQLLALASALGLEHAPDIVCPQGSSAARSPRRDPTPSVHANPFYRYKRWNDSGWRGLARGLAQRGCGRRDPKDVIPPSARMSTPVDPAGPPVSVNAGALIGLVTAPCEVQRSISDPIRP